MALLTELPEKLLPDEPVSWASRNGIPPVPFLLFTLVFLLAFVPLWKDVWRFASESDYHSHIILIPPVSLFLIYLARKKIFARVGFSKRGMFLLIPALLLQLAWMSWGPLSRFQDTLALSLVLSILIWMGGFACFLGMASLRRAAFPLGFLVFAVPPPFFLESVVIGFLQACSADLSHLLIRALGVPIFREGFVFVLPGIALEVARECSGIRSTLALLICSVLFGYLRLERGWAKSVLALATVPITIFTNSVRIVLLSLLSVYIDVRILETSHHYSAGKVTFALAFALLFLVLLGLERWESRPTGSAVPKIA